MRTILDDINDLLEMGVGQTTRLKIIKDDIQARKTLWSADVHYVEELSRSFLQNKKNPSKSKNEKITIIGTILVLGLFFVFFIIPIPDYNTTPAEVSPSPAEVSPSTAEPMSDSTEFSSANVIHSSSSTQN